MSCSSCGEKSNGYCKVCQVLDDDNKIKKVTFCNMCGVWICKECESDVLRRFGAFKSELKRKVKEALKIKKNGK